MKIIDKRNEYAWIPATAILEEIILLFRKENFAGIRNVVLLDRDYHDELKGVGRYLRIGNTRTADIEIYFQYFDKLPRSVTTNRMYLSYFLTEVLMHEIYHHIVRGQKRIKKSSDKQEEVDASKWAKGAVRHVFQKLFPRSQYGNEWEKIQSLFREKKNERGPMK